MRMTADFLLENIKAKDNAMTFLTFWKKKKKDLLYQTQI